LKGLGRPWRGVELGLWLGFGLLSKATFALVAGPLVIAEVLLARDRRVAALRASFVAAMIAAVIAGWFLAPNAGGVIAYAREAQLSVRASHGSLSVPMLRAWGSEIIDWGAGRWMIVPLLLMAVNLAFVLPRVPRPVVICLVGAVPLVAMQVFFSANQGVRVITPAFIPGAIALAYAAGTTRLLARRWFFGVTMLAAVGQLVWPTAYRSLCIAEFWDWEPLYALCQQRNLSSPTVAFLGSGTFFNPPMIQGPWARRGEDVRVRWMWRYEDGPIDWSRIDEQVDSADVILAAPGYVGDVADKQDRDNAPGAAFVERMKQRGGFAPPVTIMMGQRQPTAVLAFVRARSNPPSRGGTSLE
jgi:hypothetical protein